MSNELKGQKAMKYYRIVSGIDDRLTGIKTTLENFKEILKNDGEAENQPPSPMVAAQAKRPKLEESKPDPETEPGTT